MMNVLTDIMCDTSLMTPQNYKETLSQNRMLSTQPAAAKSLHVIGSVPQMESSINHSTLDVYNSNPINPATNLHSSFDESGDMSVFSDPFPEIVPSWLTHDFMKASESLSSPNILSNVPDIYQPRENEHLEMLDLGFSPELTSQDVSTNNLNQSCITQELPIQRFQNNDSLLLTSLDEISITDLNSMQYQKFKHNVHLNKQPSIVDSVLPGDHLLHLPLHSSLSEQCLTSTSSPMLMSNTQSQMNQVNVICDKVPQLNLNNLNSLLHNDNALSEIQLLPQNFSNAGMDGSLTNSNQPCLTAYNGNTSDAVSFLNSNTTPLLMQDASIQVSDNFGSNNFLQDHQCISCCQVDSQSAIDVVQCFKCRFCDFISLHKCAISSHIKSLHSNPPEIFSNSRNDTPPIVTSSISTIEVEGMLSNPNSSVNSTVILLVQPTVNNNMQMVNNNIMVTGSERKKCSFCNKIFTNNDDLKSHLLSHQGLSLNNNRLNCPNANILTDVSNLFRCIKCNKVYKDASSYVLHLSSEHNSDPKSVLLTKKNGTTYPSMLNSRITINQLQSSSINSNPGILPKEVDNSQLQSKLKPILCKKVESPNKNKAINSKEDVVSSSEKTLSANKRAWQIKMKRELASYICEFKGCNVRYRVLDNLEYHRKCHASNGSAFVCPECGLSQISWRNVAGHLWRNHKIDMELHACDQCPFRTYSLSRLETIHKRVHDTKCSFLCDICGKGFKNGKQMHSHKERHTADSPTKKKKKRGSCKCYVCGASFPSKILLHHHKDVMHNIEPKSHQCPHCSYKTSKKATLFIHVRSHTGEKPFACDQCDYRTADHNTLRRHKQRHSGERPYRCPHCPYTAIQAQIYKRHLLKKHPSVGGVFSCNICSFGTLKRETYEQHLRDHESLVILQNANSMNEVSSTEEMFPITEAMNISLSRGDNGFIPHLNKHKTV